MYEKSTTNTCPMKSESKMCVSETIKGKHVCNSSEMKSVLKEPWQLSLKMSKRNPSKQLRVRRGLSLRENRSNIVQLTGEQPSQCYPLYTVQTCDR